MPYDGIPYAVLDARYLMLDCTNDPLTAGLQINAATADEPVLTLRTTDDDTTNPMVLFETSAGAEIARFQVDADNNITIGRLAGRDMVAGGGKNNFLAGYQAGIRNTTGDHHVAIGQRTLTQNLTTTGNFALGSFALSVCISNSNVGIGTNALRVLTTGLGVIGIGFEAGRNRQTGNFGVYIGYKAGYTGITAAAGVMIGSYAGYFETNSNRLYIANTDTTTPLIYGEFDTFRLAFGNQYAVDKYGELAHASGYFAAVGDAQASPDSFIVRRAVASHAVNTWYPLYPDGGTTLERLMIAADSAWMVDILVIGLTQNSAQQWAYQIIGVLERDNANNTTLAVMTVAAHLESDTFYDVQLVADDANEALEVQIRRTGGVDYDIRWVATIRHVQAGYP